jgi:hypothetical protein
MSRLLCTTAVLACFVSSSLAQPPAAQSHVFGARDRVEYAPEGAGFKVSFKARPDEEHAQSRDGTTINMALLIEENGGYMMSYADASLIGPGETPERTQRRLDGARDGGLRGALGRVNAKLIKEEHVTLGKKKYPGREFWGELPGQRGLLKARIFIANARLYQLLVIGSKEFVEADETDIFLRSLELTE